MADLHIATYLSIIVCPENEVHALFLISNDILIGCDVMVQEVYEGSAASSIFGPFKGMRSEKCMTLALAHPIYPEDITDLAELVITGIISGFVVQRGIGLGNFLNSRISEEDDGPLTASDQYQTAIDTGTTEYYYADLRREEFRRDERHRALFAKVADPPREKRRENHVSN